MLGLALLPALGFMLGAMLAEAVRLPPRALGAVLHLSVGAALAVVVLELAPRSLLQNRTALSLAAFALGGGLSLFSLLLTKKVRGAAGIAQPGAAAVFVVAGVDVFTDGLLTGAGSAVAADLGVLLALSQVVANAPGGFGAAARLKAGGGSRRRRLVLAAAMMLPALAAAAAGWAGLRGQSAAVQAVALAGACGLLLTATLEDLVPEADRPQPPRPFSTLALVTGFVALAALSWS